MNWRNAALLLATPALAAHAATAVPDPRPCLTENEASDLTQVLLPPLVTAVAARCGPALPAGAFLVRAAPSLATGYRPAANSAWPRVRIAAERLGANELSGFLSEDVERGVMEQAVAGAIVANIALKDCITISDFAEAAAPLPPRNIGRLIALVLRTKFASGVPFRVCAAGGDK